MNSLENGHIPQKKMSIVPWTYAQNIVMSEVYSQSHGFGAEGYMGQGCYKLI